LWEFHQAADPSRIGKEHDGSGAAVRVAPVSTPTFANAIRTVHDDLAGLAALGPGEIGARCFYEPPFDDSAVSAGTRNADALCARRAATLMLVTR
jgi:hypothetical protein